MFTMMNRVLGTNTNKSNKNKNRLHEIKNGNTLGKTSNMKPPKKSQLAKTSKNQQISQHPQKCGSFQIKQASTIFQTEEQCNPRKFSHAKRRETTVLGMSLFTIYINVIFGFPLPFSFPFLISTHSFSLVHLQLSFIHDQTKPSQVILPHLFINNGHPNFLISIISFLLFPPTHPTLSFELHSFYKNLAS